MDTSATRGARGIERPREGTCARLGLALAGASLLLVASACDRGESAPAEDEAPRDEPAAAVEGARADRPDEGKPEASKLSASEVLQLCGNACSGSVCVGERLCDCLSVDDVCEVAGCRDHPTCPEGDQGG